MFVFYVMIWLFNVSDTLIICVAACVWISFAAGGNSLEQADDNSDNDNFSDDDNFLDIPSVCDTGYITAQIFM